jgi:hypothetical protein
MKNLFNKIINWIKENKVTSILILVILFLLFRGNRSSPTFLRSKGMYLQENMGVDSVSLSVNSYGKASGVSPSYEVAPRADITDRKVITTSSMSLQVKSVRETMNSIKTKVRGMGGYVVDTSVTTPEFGEEGSVAVRIPAENLDETLEYFRSLSIKVVSENISGYDITDEYVDIEERLGRLESTKETFESILDEAETVEEILKVQREIFNIQDQIDYYKGQLNYMEGASSTTLIRIYLSTDELGLPYTPAQTWRPKVIFKQATRSLLLNLIKVGNAAIWLVVYLPVIALVLVVYILIKKVVAKKKTSSQN